MQLVILAGGLGTRLKPITEKIPKAMVPVRGRPFLEYQILFLLDQGFKDFVIVSGYRSEMIEDFVSRQSWSQKIRVLSEGGTLRGTGGCLSWAQEQGALKEKFLLLYGDSFLPIRFDQVAEQFRDSRRKALMTVLKNRGAWDRSNVIFREGELELYQKGLPQTPAEMTYIDYGLLGLSSSLFDPESVRSLLGAVPEKWDLADLLTVLSRRKELQGYEVFERFYEVGSFEGLQDFENLVGRPPWTDFFDKART